MADSGDQMKHSILKLALFVGFGDSDDSHDHQPRYRPHSTGARSTRSLAAGDGAVGLAILAAMSASRDEQVRSEPVLIGGSVVTKPGVMAASVRKGEEEEGVMDLSESYTCVISHLGGNRVKKRIYCGDGDDGVVLEPPPPLPSEIADPPFVVAEFLRFCSMCKRKLDGRDVYMYRGEKAFCSEECRFQLMALDEFGEKLSSGTMKNCECSSSPCSASLLVAAGIAAA